MKYLGTVILIPIMTVALIVMLANWGINPPNSSDVLAIAAIVYAFISNKKQDKKIDDIAEGVRFTAIQNDIQCGEDAIKEIEANIEVDRKLLRNHSNSEVGKFFSKRIQLKLDAISKIREAIDKSYSKLNEIQRGNK